MYTFTKMTGDKIHNKRNRRTQSKRRDQKNTFHPLAYYSAD